MTDLENMPSNKGYIFSGQKFYGDLNSNDHTHVELFDVDTNKFYIWNRHGCVTLSDKKSYETSNKMLPCPTEAKTGYCSQRFHPDHHKFFYHYCHFKPRIYQGKLICKYSLTNKETLCWERFNAEHNKNYHHCE